MDRYSIFAVCTITQNFHPQEDCASNTDPNAVTAEYSARDVAQPADRAWHPFSNIDLKKGPHREPRRAHSVYGHVFSVRDQI